VHDALEQLQDGLAEVQLGQVQVQATLGQMQATLGQMQATLEKMEARQANDRRRRQNRLAQQAHPQSNLVLAPLVKEQPPPAGDAGAAALGALPAANIFPQTWAAVMTLSTAQLNTLANFYGEQFGPGALAIRRAAFMAFIT
jgi:hypothetical protein